jgi:hypothetical protein
VKNRITRARKRADSQPGDFMRTNPLYLFGLIALAAGVLHSQPTNGPVYWSVTMPDCSSLQETAVSIKNSSGAVIGYSCYVSGTFVWFAAGGGWTSKIRVGAPSTAPVGVDYTFYDTNGNNLNVDTTSGTSPTASGNEVSFALSANQPSEIVALGATSSAPNYGPTTTGTVYALFYCPDATTCLNVLPQLVYLQQPTHPWLAAVPIAWDNSTWPTWSAVGVDDGVTNVVSFVVYNEGTVATSFNIYIYNSTGALVATGTTPSIPPLPLLSDGSYGEAGTYGATLRTVISSPLPSGTFKILIDGGNEDSAVLMLQFSGLQYAAPSMSSMQVAYDSAPSSTATVAAAVRSTHAKRARTVPTQKRVFDALPQ